MRRDGEIRPSQLASFWEADLVPAPPPLTSPAPSCTMGGEWGLGQEGPDETRPITSWPETTTFRFSALWWSLHVIRMDRLS